MFEFDSTPVCREVDGLLTIEWPNGRPAFFSISSDLFEDMVAQINDLRLGVTA
jgi:hypothetical protein